MWNGRVQSLALIDNDHIKRTRVFERTPEEGTTVTTDLREATKDDDLDVLAPVRQSLGADISGSLFGSTKNVFVEGYIDKLYLNSFSNYFRRRGEDATFDYQTSLVNVDGSKTEYMVRFLDAEGYDYTILLNDDDGQGAKSHKETLVEKDVDEDRIILVSDVLDDADEDAQVEIEDLIPAEIFCEVVTEQYPDDVDPDELVEATGEEYNTMPDAVKAKIQAREQGELEDGAFDRGDIAETICD